MRGTFFGRSFFFTIKNQMMIIIGYVIANVDVLYFYMYITFPIKYLIFKMNIHFHIAHYVVVMPKFTYII